MTDTMAKPMSEERLEELADRLLRRSWDEKGTTLLYYTEAQELIAEVRRLRKQNEKLVGLLKETDAFANNIRLEISQLFREIGVKDE